MFFNNGYNRSEMIECLRDHVYYAEESNILQSLVSDYIEKKGVDGSLFCAKTESNCRILLDNVPHDLLMLLFKFIMTLHVYDCGNVGGGRCD
jgi:hypothetical protein